MNDRETKQAIVSSRAGFAAKPLADAATALFESLGYRSRVGRGINRPGFVRRLLLTRPD